MKNLIITGLLVLLISSSTFAFEYDSHRTKFSNLHAKNSMTFAQIVVLVRPLVGGDEINPAVEFAVAELSNVADLTPADLLTLAKVCSAQEARRRRVIAKGFEVMGITALTCDEIIPFLKAMQGEEAVGFICAHIQLVSDLNQDNLLRLAKACSAQEPRRMTVLVAGLDAMATSSIEVDIFIKYLSAIAGPEATTLAENNLNKVKGLDKVTLLTIAKAASSREPLRLRVIERGFSVLAITSLSTEELIPFLKATAGPEAVSIAVQNIEKVSDLSIDSMLSIARASSSREALRVRVIDAGLKALNQASFTVDELVLIATPIAGEEAVTIITPLLSRVSDLDVAALTRLAKACSSHEDRRATVITEGMKHL